MVAVNIDNNLTPWVEIKRGVRRGCLLLPKLFPLYEVIIFRRLEGMEGIKIKRVNINNIRFADDLVVTGDTPEKLQTILDLVNRKREAMGLKINMGKNKITVASKNPEMPNCNIMINSIRIKLANSLVYLSGLITQDAKAKQDIERKIKIV